MFPGLVNYRVSAGLSEKAPFGNLETLLPWAGDSGTLRGGRTPTPAPALLLLHSRPKHGLEKQEDPGSNLGPEACRK